MNSYQEQRLKEEQAFLHDVRNHKVTILKDELVDDNPDGEDTLGYYRHIRCRDPKSYNRSFEIISVPYYLTMVGDMGSWTWSRLKDNFCFFRADDDFYKSPNEGNKQLFVNPGYWGEKLQAIDRGGLTEYSEEALKSHMVDEYKAWLEEKDRTTEECQEVKEAIREVYSAENEYQAHEKLYNFEEVNGFCPADTWEWKLTKATGRYIWACYAVAWTVREYDKMKGNQ